MNKQTYYIKTIFRKTRKIPRAFCKVCMKLYLPERVKKTAVYQP